EPLTEAPRDRTSLEDFPKDALYIYIVAARDAAGNLGPPSAPAEVVADTRQAHATFVIPGDQPLTQGDHALTVTLTEPLGSDLKLALRFPRAVVRELQPTKKDALTYEATLTFTEKDPDCRVYLKVDGEDRYGNKGIRIVRGSSFTIDTGPPRSRVTTTPPGRVPLGAVPVRVEFFEGVKDGAALWYTIDGKRVDVPIKRQRDQVFVGQLALTADSPNGVAEFHTSATDSHGHAGGAVVEGKAFTIDTRAPEPPLNMTVRPGPVRALLLTWSRPTAEPVDHFRLYAAPTQDVKPGKDTLRAERVRDTKATHKLGENEILWFVVTAVDRAGNESGPSKAVKGVPDVTAPPPPTALRVVLGHDLRVRLAWTAPQADEPVRYHVYRLDKPAQGVAGHKPVLEVDAAEAIDVPKKDGLYHYLVTAVDEAGNASAPAAAEPFDFDVNAPTATVALAPTEGTRGYRESYYVHYDIGVLAAGEKAVTLSPSEPLSEAPTLRYRTRTMDTPRELALQQAAPPSAAAPGGAWTGAIAIPEKTDDGKLLFLFQGTDRKGNRGDVIPRGKGNVLWIDTTRPEAVQPLEAASLPVGKVALTWSRPPREGSGDVKYFVYRASEPFEQLGDLKPIKAGLDRPAYTDEPTEDGTYHYAVIAVDRAGNVGKLHRSVAAASDGTPPAAPTDVKAAVKGRLTLSWQAPADEALVFRVLRGDIVAAEGLRERTFVDAPDEDGDYAYRVIAVDGAGNESAPSSQAKVAFVNTLPVATITTEPASPARSTFRVVVASSQTLKAPPDLFIHFARGKPVRVPCVPRDGKFVGSVQVTKDTPNGPARFTFRATSAAGHVGDGIRSGAAVVIDTRPPSAKLALSPPSPLKAGTVRLTLTPSEPLADMPKLAYTTMGAQARTVALTAKDKGYVAEIEITADDEDGIGFLSFSGIDKAGNTGTRLGGERFAIDSHPPKAPTALAAAPQARGRVELTWTPPAYSARETADAVAGYNIYASADDITERGTLEPILRLARRMPIQVTPPADGKLFFAVTTVDTAGHESAPSKSATCVVDRTPPAPPTVRAQAAPGSIELSWDAAEDAVAFHVLVLAPGERDWRRVAEKIDEKAFSYRPLQGGRYAVRVQAVDVQGQVSLPSKAVPVEFVQNAPLARIQGIGKRLGAGAFPVAMETTRPLVRPPTLRLVPEGGAPIAIPMQGAGNTWRGVLTVVKAEKGGPARLEFEGVAQVGGQEVTGRSILTATDVALDFEPPTVAVEFVERTPSRERKSILKAGRHRFRVRASEPLRAAPVVDFTPRGKATQRAELVKQSDTVWAGVLVVDEKVGDGTGMFEVTAVDTQGNTGDAITVNRVVDIDTTPPEAIARLRAVPLPRGKVRCDWTAPT
ncbi:hypothetical protein HQ560_16650, partial [bacterium]|nr:hypothetical protein [bacterium]